MIYFTITIIIIIIIKIIPNIIDQVGAVDIFQQNSDLSWTYSSSNYNYFSNYQSRSGCYLTSSKSSIFNLPCPNASSLGNIIFYSLFILFFIHNIELFNLY